MPKKFKKRRIIKTIKPRSVTKKAVQKKPKPVKKTAVKKRITKEKVLGKVTHYFPKVRAAVIKLKDKLAVGDTIKIKGHTTDFTQTISSMQIDREPIRKAKRGQEIGLLVDSRVRRHDIVFLENKSA